MALSLALVTTYGPNHLLAYFLSFIYIVCVCVSLSLSHTHRTHLFRCIESLQFFTGFLQGGRAQFIILNILKWSKKGDKMSKLFFDVVTPRPRKFQMGALKRDDDTLSTNPDQM